MLLYEEILGGQYRIASLPYDEREEVQEEIQKHWEGAKAEVYYCVKENKWYVKEPAW